MNKLVVSLILVATVVSASAEARVLLGPSVRVALDGKREWGVGLRPDTRGWRLSIAGMASATSVVFVDQTAPTHDKWVLAIEGGSMTLDGARFHGGHAYRVEVRNGASTVDRGLVYLYPARGGHNARVAFEVEAEETETDDEGIRVTPKSAL